MKFCNWTLTLYRQNLDKKWTFFCQMLVRCEKTLDKEICFRQNLDNNQNFLTKYGQLFDKT